MPNLADTLVRSLAGLAAMPFRHLRPHQLDRQFLFSLDDFGLPPGDVVVKLRRLEQTTRTIPAFIVAEGVTTPRRVENTMASFVVKHPEATILVDPSICINVNERVLSELSPALRPLVRPDPSTIPTIEAMRLAELDSADVAFALPTHLHWDHVSGLLDLPGLPIVVRDVEHDWMTSGATAPADGVRSALVDRPVTQYRLDGPPVLTFARSHDLFGDGSVVLVDLAGHTPGSVGILLRTSDGPTLLAGDAAWHSIQIDRVRPKAAFPGRLVDADRATTLATLHRLHAIADRVRIIPTHDPHA
ncbi:MBL fold metallo-hydrolase [Gordonia sp. MP11Mi]|uniref:Metallo-beta-lactamase domain-containing protein n=1 Tax=Gordonia sp. MP11Mi TaxID=3022769 RepID=A0AA97CX04_9ACTN